MLKTEHDIYELVRGDVRMMRVLQQAASLELPDWWIGAGFLRNRVWDELCGNAPADDGCDVDLAYFDPADTRPEHDWKLEEHARKLFPNVCWEIRNQARFGESDGYESYTSCADGIAHWPETASAIGARLRSNGELELLFTHGIDDLLRLVARPVTNNGVSAPMDLVLERVEKKGWCHRWPDLRVRQPEAPQPEAPGPFG